MRMVEGKHVFRVRSFQPSKTTTCGVLLLASVLVLTACGDPGSPGSDGNGRADEQDEGLDSSAVVDADGQLAPQIEGVVEVISEYDPGPEVDDLEALVDRVDAVVLARSTARSQIGSEASDYVATLQRFATTEVLAGAIGDEFVVRLPGGVSEQDGTVLVEDAEQPQFRAGREYLLFLEETSTDGTYWTFGPSTGRYLVEDGRVVGSVELDRQGEREVSPFSPMVAEEIVSQDIAALRSSLR